MDIKTALVQVMASRQPGVDEYLPSHGVTWSEWAIKCYLFP